MRLPGARVTFTTRQGGVSDGPYESLNLGILTADDPERVTENRHRAAAQAGVEAERVAMGWQVHGTELKEWTGPPPDRAYAQPGRQGSREGRRPPDARAGHRAAGAGGGLLPGRALGR